MNIGFWDNQLCERGTTVSLFDYAYYNVHILGNHSYIFYDKNGEFGNNKNVIEKFKKHFIVHETSSFEEVDKYYIQKYHITHMYIIKAGLIDDRLSKLAKNCIHCVFTCSQPHGDIYTSISPIVDKNNGKFPVVPHMINLPKHNKNMRKELNIPENAVVFGGYGGKRNFSIKFARKVVYSIASSNPNIYFLFARFGRFCPELPNIIHVPCIVDLDEKVKFINTTDAMLWAREDGEVFSLAMGEFSSMNKPIICMNIGSPGHVHMLKYNALWYSNKRDLTQILLNFNPIIERQKDWNAYKEYTPEKVMDVFKNIFLV